MPSIFIPTLWLLWLNLAALALGLCLFDRLRHRFNSPLEEGLIGWALGMGVLSHGAFALAVIGALTPGTSKGFLIVVGVVSVALGRKRVQSLLASLRGLKQWGWADLLLLALFAAPFLWMTLRVFTPAHGAIDPLAYHLALPKSYLMHSGLYFNPTIKQSLYPQQMEMLFTLGLGSGGEAISQGVAASYVAALGLLLLMWGEKRLGSRRGGLFAAGMALGMPMIYVFGFQCYVDIALAFHLLMALYFWEAALEEEGRASLLLSGLFLGMALAIKHNALVAAALWTAAAGVWAVWKGDPRKAAALRLLLFLGVAVAWVSPYYLRALIETANPFWPRFSEWLPSPHYRPLNAVIGRHEDPFLAKNIAGHAFQDGPLGVFKRAFDALWNPAFGARNDLQHVAGPLFLLFLPFAFLVPPLGRGRKRLLLYLGLAFFAYLFLLRSHPRYAMPFFLLAALAGGVGWAHCVQRWRPLAALGAVGLVWMIGTEAKMVYQLTQVPYHNLGVANGDPNALLNGVEPKHRLFDAANRDAPEDAVFLLQGLVAGYWSDRDYYWDHPNQTLIDYTAYADEDAMAEALDGLGITHVLRWLNPIKSRTGMGYPHYYQDPLQQAFAAKYLRLRQRVVDPSTGMALEYLSFHPNGSAR